MTSASQSSVLYNTFVKINNKTKHFIKKLWKCFVLLFFITIFASSLKTKVMGKKKIYQLEGGQYQIVTINRRKVVQFVHNGNIIQLDNLKVHDDMSEETMCFSADMYFNGKFAGNCSNDGRGGCANVYPEYEFRQYAHNELSNVDNYIFNKPDNVYDIMDSLACYQASVDDCRGNKAEFDKWYAWVTKHNDELRAMYKKM